MNVLITGITGHIGLSLAKVLSKTEKVYGVYNKKPSKYFNFLFLNPRNKIKKRV